MGYARRYRYSKKQKRTRAIIIFILIITSITLATKVIANATISKTQANSIPEKITAEEEKILEKHIESQPEIIAIPPVINVEGPNVIEKVEEIFEVIETTETIESPSIEESTKLPDSVTEEDIIVLAKTLYGEAKSVESTCEQSMVVWVVLNRLDYECFGSTITKVCTAEYQFAGYLASNPVDEECVELVKDVLMRWQAEKEGKEDVGRTIPKEFIFFSADSKPELGIWHNRFYRLTEFNRGSEITYDRDHPISNPYAN